MRRTYGIFLAILFLALVGVAASAAPLSSPEQLLARSRVNESEWRKVVAEINDNLSKIESRETFEKQLRILSSLQKVGRDLQIDPEGFTLIRLLGEQMAQLGTRWIHPTDDDFSIIVALHEWMSLGNMFSFQEDLVHAAATETQLEKLKILAANAEALEEWAKIGPSEFNLLRVRYSRILSSLALRILRKYKNSDSDFSIWLQKVTSSEDLIEILRDLLAQISAHEKASSPPFSNLLIRFDQIRDQVSERGDPVSTPVRNLVGDAAGELIRRGLILEVKFPEGTVAQLLTLLNPLQLQFIAGQIAQPNREISPVYLEDFFNVGYALTAALESAGLTRTAWDFRSFSWNLYLKTKVVVLDIEGTYALEDRAGKKWIFTLARVREHQYFAALADARGYVHKSFTNVVPDPDGKNFLASEREADTDPAPNWTITFQINDDKSISLNDPRGDPANQPLRGRRKEIYPDYFGEKGSGAATLPQGRYRGPLRMANGSLLEARLDVMAFPNYTIGRLTDGRNFFLNMNVGSKGTQGALYLTTGRLYRRTWTQLRGRLDGSEYRGVLVIGGVGLLNNFVLTKAKE